MAEHTEEQIVKAAAIMQQAYLSATAELEEILHPEYRAIA